MIGFVKRKIAKLQDNRFGMNVVILAGGTTIAQALALLVSPILTRIYTPTDFGVLTVYISILAILVVIGSMRYELAIPLPDDDESAVNLMAVCLFILVVVCTFTVIFVWVLGEQIGDWVHTPSIKNYLWLLPFSLFGAGFYQILNFWIIRKQSFFHIAKTKLTQNISMVIVQLLLGLLRWGSLGLILGDVAGRTGGSATLAKLAWKTNKDNIAGISITGMLAVAHRYKRFPMISSISSLLNTVGLQLPTLLLAFYYGPQIAGWFNLAQTVVGAPMSLIGQAVAQVYIGEASTLVRSNTNQYKKLFINVGKRLFMLGLLPIGLLAWEGPKLFGFIFGLNWIHAGEYTQVLAIMFLVQFVVVPLSQTLIILEKQNWQLVWDGSRMILVVGVIGIAGYSKWSAHSAVLIYGMSMLFSYVMLGVLSVWAVKKTESPQI